MMSTNPKADYMKWSITLIASAACLMLPDIALADGGLSGGLNTVKSQVTLIKDAALSIGAVAAVVYLLWKAIQAWQGRCEWGEFGISVAYVAFAGASATIAGWAWKVLQ